MSPLWRDEVAILLAPRRVVLVRRARGIRPRVVAATEVPVPEGPDAPLGPVLAAMADVLADPMFQGADARVVVADHPWVRYAVVPWPGTRLDDAGRLVHARYVLGDAYGDGVKDWVVALADTPPGRPYVACAMPSGLRGALEAILSDARLGLVSLQPRLVAAFGAWRRRLPAGDAWFVSMGDEALAAAHLHRGAWDRVHVARTSPEGELELRRLQAFDRATRAPGAPARILVDAPAWVRRAVSPGDGIEWLEDEGEDATPETAILRRRVP